MFTNSIQGIENNIELMRRYARNLQDIEKADLPSDMVGMMVAGHGLSANVGAFKAAINMQENILDLLA